MTGSVFTDHVQLTATIVATPLALTHQLQLSLAWVRDDVSITSQTGVLSMPGMRVHTFTSENAQPLIFPCDFDSCALHRGVMPAPSEGGRPRLAIYYVTNIADSDDTAEVDGRNSLFSIVLSGTVQQAGVKYNPQE